MFVARDAEQRVLCCGNAGVPKGERADEVLRFVDFWERHTGFVPAELVFDSRLTTYANLSRLNRRGVRFLTLRRRSRQLLGRLFSRPASAWQRVTLPVEINFGPRDGRSLAEPIALRWRPGAPGRARPRLVPARI